MTEQGEGLLGSSALIPETEQFLHNQRIGLVHSIDVERADKGFLFYLFNTKTVRSQIRASASGTKVRHTAPERIYRVKVSLPSLAEQQRIASILSAYDDLIENNRRRIALLEEAARQLYKEWFIRFRFPGHEHVKIIDGVPEGWEMRSFDTLADFLNGFAFKPHHLGDAGLPIVKIPELKGGVLGKTPRYDGEGVPEKYLLNTGDLIFSWSGTLAIDFWCDGPAYLNQHLFKVMPYDDVSAAHLLVAIREAMVMFENQTVGATMKHIRRSALSDVKVPIPPVSLYSSFRDAVDSLYNQVVNLRSLSRNAAKARDLLLPKLMSGAIAV
ncbi:restriction endonuclease S subunit [Acetobacter peroxydans]|nr:restriction endonuclease S subunit [Acetobacter peroxydans NBRC 13755]GBR40624.1 restriction endonuclease S subunit [Acetobacter peroxydans]